MWISKAILYSSSDIKISELKTLDLTDYQWSDQYMRLYEKAQKRCQERSVFSLIQDTSDYHFKFSHLSSAPYIVYGKWNQDILHKSIIAIVGPRNASPYASQVMESLFSYLQHYDLVTISWLADGVDMMCHEMSIKAGIPTIAVLGWWLKYYLESGKREMIQKIIDNGWLVLSEFKLNSRPERYTFPQRNRIVAGLSDMVFLPEASEKSGSLITVDFARQMHKDVYGAPNTMFSPTSQWLHNYMQQWLVTPVVQRDWMLGKYFGKKVTRAKEAEEVTKVSALFDKEFSQVEQMLQKNPAWLKLEELVRDAGLSVEEVMSQLTMSEIMWSVMNDNGVWRLR